MAPSPQCVAIAAAQKKTGLSYSQIAAQMGTSEQRVIDIVTAKQHPTDAEFKSIAKVLGIVDSPPHNSAHATS